MFAVGCVVQRHTNTIYGLWAMCQNAYSIQLQPFALKLFKRQFRNLCTQLHAECLAGVIAVDFWFNIPCELMVPCFIQTCMHWCHSAVVYHLTIFIAMHGLECVQKSYSGPLCTYVILLAKGFEHVKQ